MTLVLILIAGLMGASGVVLAAAAAHAKSGMGLDGAGYLLLFHAVAVLSGVALLQQGLLLRPLVLGVLSGGCLAAHAAIGLEREAGPAQKISAISKRCKNVPALVSCLCPGEMLRPVIVGAGCCCAGPVGMMATNDAIIRASSRSFLARRPLALANCRSLNGLIWRTDMPAASKARTTPRS